LGWPPKGAIAHHEKKNYKKLTKKDSHFEMNIDTHNGNVFKLVIKQVNENEISIELPNQEHIKLANGEWSEWLTLTDNTQTGVVSFKLLSNCYQTSQVDILQSQINSPKMFSENKIIER